MGPIAFFTSGAVLYNPLSSSDGSLASYYEWDTLDPCYGHSSVDKQYHYHAVRHILLLQQGFSTYILSTYILSTYALLINSLKKIE